MGKIVIFRVHGKMMHNQVNRFCQKFYGQDTTTHGGRYKYRKRGLLDDIHHRKLIRGVLILRDDDSDIVLEFLQEWGAEFYVREVKLEDEDIEFLRGMQSDSEGEPAIGKKTD